MNTLDASTVGTFVETFIDSFVDILTDNLPIVLAFAGAILVWFVLKKWVFGGSHRI